MSKMSTMISIVTSADGTAIACDTRGSGPALVLVDGALCHRGFGPSKDLAEQLKDSFTVYRYDRRGRGDSGSGESPYDVAREVEDLAAVIAAAGGTSYLLGVSSGAALALEAARRGIPMRALATYEAPFILDGSQPPTDPAFPERVQELVDRGDRGGAVVAFMRLVGAPAPMVLLMKLMPVWKGMKAVAHTLPYDLSIVVPHGQGRPLPEGYFNQVAVPTLALAGGKSPEYLRNAQVAIAGAVPNARSEELAGQTHMVRAKVLAPVVTRFFQG